MVRKHLGQVLLAMGVMSESQLNEAVSRLRSTPGTRLGEYLVESGIATEHQVAVALAEQFGLPLGTEESIPLDLAVARSISEEYAHNHRAIPVYQERGTLVVALVDPLDMHALDDIGFVSGMPIQALVVTSETLAILIRRAFGKEGPGAGKAAARPLGLELAAGPAPTPGLAPWDKGPPPDGFLPRQSAVESNRATPPELGFETPPASRPATEEDTVVSLCDEILKSAVELGASDVHIEPKPDALRVRYRIDGILREVRLVDKAMQLGIISRLKIVAGMDISERRIPQDGRLEMQVAGHDVDLRVSTLPTIHGEKVVIRILDKARGIPSLASLGLSQPALIRFRRAMQRSHGMILACGPTGSGKTTTIISTLRELTNPRVNVVTIEDPVEYELDDVNHVALNLRAGLTFASGLRAMLRQDPDIILLGEIRDGETAEIATRAALTGHLLLSTLHTNDAVGAINRLVDMKVERFLVAAALAGVIAQRLVRKLCTACREPYWLGEDDPRIYLLGDTPRPIKLWRARARGCAQCQGAGFRGRIGLYEVLAIDQGIREMIMQGGTQELMNEAAKAAGMETLLEDGLQKALQGVTSLDEVLRVSFVE